VKFGIFPTCLGRKDAGPETYERELIAGLCQLPSHHEFHVFCFNDTARAAIKRSAPNLHIHTLSPNIRALAMTLDLPTKLSRLGMQAYHATFVPAPLARTPCVFTMHDVSPFTRPEFYPFLIRHRLQGLVKRGLETAKVILCVSENSRDTTEELFGIDPDRLVVAPHGIDPSFEPKERAAAKARVGERFGLTTPYVLYVGKLEARKNICRLLRAFNLVRSRAGSDIRLVLVGRRFWDLEDMDATISECGLQSHVVELGYVPWEDLPYLYSAAEAFVFPSIWEGFGFPVLEAMRCGTPVITSNVSCLPEIAGGAALLVDPFSVEQIAQGILAILGDKERAAAQAKRGLTHAAKFTWERTARTTLAAYERAASM
jgi:glycosyltransferase involved in cell wall biosynthesis